MRSCPRCSSLDLTHDGHDQHGRIIYACAGCRRHATIESMSLVSDHRFPRDVILLAVRYYLQLGAAAERIAGLLADRGSGGRSPATPAKGGDDVAGGRDLREDPRYVALPVSGH